MKPHDQWNSADIADHARPGEGNDEMTDVPERIWIDRGTKGEWMKRFKRKPDSEHEYIRKDLAQAMVAAAYEDAATYWQKRGDAGNGAPYMAPSIMRKRTPTDARAALEARDKRVREDALREAAAVVSSCTWGDYWRKDGENLAPINLSDDILALIDRTAEEEA